MSIQDTSVTTDRLRSRAVSQGPFNHAQNIYLFFGGGDRGEIVDAISRTLGAGDGKLVSVHGEPGSGKTLMSLVLADRLKHRRNIIRFDHESIDAATLLRHLLIEISPRDADAVVNNVVADSDSAEPCTDLALQRLWLALQSPLPNDKPFLLLVDSDARLDGALGVRFFVTASYAGRNWRLLASSNAAFRFQPATSIHSRYGLLYR